MNQKMLKISLIMLLIGCFISSTNAQIISFDMDKVDNKILPNSSKKDITGKIEGNLSFVPDRFGNDCRALAFDGSGYISIPHHDKLDLEEFTVSVWLKLPSANFQWLTVICKGENPTESTNSPAFRVQLTSATASFNSISTKTIGNIRQIYPVNTWFHLGVVKDADNFLVYVDGKIAYQIPVNIPLENNKENINIGRDIPGAKEFFIGTMDDFKLYDDALNANKIEKLFREKPAKSGSACVATPPVVVNPPVVVKPPTPVDIDIDLGNLEPENPQAPTDIDIDLNENTPQEESTDVDIDLSNMTPEQADTTLIFDGKIVNIGDLINLKNIRFQQSKADLLAESYITLNKVLKLMQDRPSIEIELLGHTDNVGDPNKNFQLSVDRVRNTKKYLVSNGIAENRIKTQAFGGTKPIADNRAEQTRKLNRRVEMKILKK